MTIGLAALVAGYGLSQFYRAFIAVLAPALGAEIGATPGDLAIASGLWFLAFAAVQLPIGWAFEAVGPRRTTAALLGVCGAGGAAVFAMATRPLHLDIAMALLGAGCAPVLMAAYYLLARCWPASAFGTMAGVTVAVGSLGDILGAAPLVRLIEAFGWRATLWAFAAITLAIAALIAALVRDPPPPEGPQRTGKLIDMLRLRGLWLIMPMVFASYAVSAAIRGLWASPYLATVHDADARMIGRGVLVMGLAVVAGNLAVGQAVRLIGGPRRASIVSTCCTATALMVLWLSPDAGLPVAYAALAVIGMSGANYALLMTHARAYLPPHLVGRGMTFLNMVSLSGVGLLQFASRPVYDSVLAARGPVPAIASVFLFFLIPLLIGLGFYLFSREAADAPA
ncbi:MFS transporter [Paracoccus suum]|nr:MFS transporter [Paracoccus suum]